MFCRFHTAYSYSESICRSWIHISAYSKAFYLSLKLAKGCCAGRNAKYVAAKNFVHILILYVLKQCQVLLHDPDFMIKTSSTMVRLSVSLEDLDNETGKKVFILGFNTFASSVWA